jgi:hypothetical protein
MTPPKVPGALNPTSSVMMISTLGAPFGGTTRGAHQPFDSEAFCLITPPNFGSGGGSCFPLSVVVAPGEPNSPVICCAETDPRHEAIATTEVNSLNTRGALIASLQKWPFYRCLNEVMCAYYVQQVQLAYLSDRSVVATAIDPA